MLWVMIALRKLPRDPRSAATRRATSFVVVVAALAAAFGLITAVGIVRGRMIGIGMPDPPLPMSYLPQILAADPGEGNTMTVVDLPALVRVLCALPGLVHAVTLVVAALLLTQVLREIARGRTFGPIGRLALARLSLVLVLGSVLCFLLDALAVWRLHVAMYPITDQPPTRWDTFGISLPTIPLLLIMLGVVAAALLHAFKDGAALERDAEGVI